MAIGKLDKRPRSANGPKIYAGKFNFENNSKQNKTNANIKNELERINDVTARVTARLA